MEVPFKSGFVAVLGPTNAGKSSLMNALVGSKVSIVSPRKQTTYHRISGVWNGPHHQVIFVDTPGFQNFPEKIARLLNRVADQGGSDCDVALWVFDVSSRMWAEEYEQLKTRIQRTAPRERSLCLLNKIDRIGDKKRLLPILQRIYGDGLFEEVIPVSVRRNDGLDQVREEVLKRIPEGPRYFPEDQLTDRSEQFLATEFIRESIYRSASQEIPYSIWVEVEQWDEEAVPVPLIHATIHVDSPSRKKILIGKQGALLKQVGIKARRQIEKMLGRQICLKLFVDLQENWKRDRRVISEYLELS